MNTRSLGVALVFVAGCAVGGASSLFVVPPASAQQAATLTKWEYSCFHEVLIGDVEPKSKALGSQAWELAAASGADVWCFKRPAM